MGRRSRKRTAPGERQRAPVPAPAARDERPKAPWHPVPLVELCVLVGLVLCVWGLIEVDSRRGRILLGAGLALGSLGGLDTVLREHFAGYRSHTTVLAGLPAVAAATLAFLAGVPLVVAAGAAIAAFGAAFAALRAAFRRRSGGLSFR